MRFLARSLTGLFLAALTLALIAAAVIVVTGAVSERNAREAPAPEGRERVFAVNVVPVEPGRVAPELKSFGQVESRRTLELRARAAGTIVELAPGFDDGAEVRAGALLVRIDPAEAQAALDLENTGLAEAEAEAREAARALELAHADLAVVEAQAALQAQALARQRNLVERGVGSDSAVEAASLAEKSAEQAVLSRRQALAAAEARVDQAATALQRQTIALSEARRRLAETEIHATFDGALSEVTAVEGGLVANNEKLALLVDPEALQVSFRISTGQYARLLDAEGRLLPARVRVSLDLAGEEIAATGTISRVDAAVGDGLTGRLLFATLDAARGFRPGDFVSVAVEEPPVENVARLPASALGADGAILVLGPDDRLEAVQVALVRRQGDSVLVRGEGIAGREAVAERSPLIGAGIRVRPLRAAPQQTAAEAPVDDMIELSPERRAQLIAFVEGNDAMPDAARQRVLAQLSQEKVPAAVVARIESRMGG